MNKTFISVSLLFVILAAACSSRQIYDSMQDRQRIECEQLPPSEYDDCMKGATMPYDTYKMEREKLDNGK